MKSFIKNIISSMLGTFIAIFLMFVIPIIFMIMAAIDKKDVVKVKNNTILDLKLDREIRDKVYDDPFEDIDFFNLSDFKRKYISLQEILNCIDSAKYDPKIRGISLDVEFVMGGWAQIKTIRDKLLEFKKSGKFITSYANTYSQKAYYLCSLADEIYLNPIGNIAFKGLYTELLFFKKLQDNTGVRFDVIRHGKFKSAVEPFLNDKMSKENLRQTQRLIDQLWNTMLEDISKSRNITHKKLNRIANELLVKYSDGAEKLGFITGTMYQQEYEDLLKRKSGVEETKRLRRISIERYSNSLGKKSDYHDDKIAVLYAQGEIVEGKGNAYEISLKSFVKAIRKIKRNENIKALVLRINSPGGSALVSELIWQELELLKKEKPLIVSFGNVAASGGYYIACGADKIVASPNTITGSIGVFGMLLNAEKLTKKWGINSEVVATHKNAVSPSIFKGASKHKEMEILKDVKQIYQTFIQRVAVGRKMSLEQVDEIGQGRVWIGRDALKKGLVDGLGDLEDAIYIAARQAGIEKYNILSYPRRKNRFEKIIEEFSLEVSSYFTSNQIDKEYYNIYKQLMKSNWLQNIQAKMPIPYQIR